jgi:hypothetical protein
MLVQGSTLHQWRLKYVIHIPKARKMKKGGAKTPPFLYEKDSWGNSSILDPYS